MHSGKIEKSVIVNHNSPLKQQSPQRSQIKRVKCEHCESPTSPLWTRSISRDGSRESKLLTSGTKFAFIESKFAVDSDAKINEFLEKPNQTTDDWEAFKKYLVEIHGLSKRDRVKLLLQGVPRDGRRPNQYAAAINELLGPVTLDDILKEIFLKNIPSEVRQQASKAYKSKSFLETLPTTSKTTSTRKGTSSSRHPPPGSTASHQEVDNNLDNHPP